MQKSVLNIMLALSLVGGGMFTTPVSALAQTATLSKSSNPFFQPYGTPHEIPPFASITPAQFRTAVWQGIQQQKVEVAAIANSTKKPTFENTIVALDQSGKLLDRAFNVFSPLASSNSTPDFRRLQSEFSDWQSAHTDDINMNAALFARVKAVYEDKKAQRKLNAEQRSLLEKTYRNFVRNGANLSDEHKVELRKLNAEIAKLQMQFNQNLMFETNNTFVTVEDPAQLEGLSADHIDRAAQLAKANGQEGKWMFNMQRASCNPVLQYCENRELRRKVYEAYYNRGNQGNAYDNKQICTRLIVLRQAKARLLGYEDFAAFALDERMAKQSKAVYDLLNAVWDPAVDKAREELNDIRAEIRRDLRNFDPEGWDFMFYQNRAKQAKYAISDSEVSEYFERGNVLKGVFYVANKLYGLSFNERTKDYPVYEPTAQSWDVFDKSGRHIAVFYSDYEPREGKRAGAWCTTFRPQGYVGNTRVEPIVVNVCNFTAPLPGKPALLSVDEVTTLFHEFGHALHSFFREVHYNGVSRVERDFVELPSQIMEHWALEPEVLKVFARHYKTGAVIPAELVKKIVESEKYGQGFATVEYLAAALVDMDLHTLRRIPTDFNIMQFETDKLAERGIPQQILPRYRVTNFSHTMGGGYTAGYYSYLWSEVLDADGFQAFKETGNIFDPATADRFRRFVLTPGSIDDGMTMYRNFRGREPHIDPLLRNRGLK